MNITVFELNSSKVNITVFELNSSKVNIAGVKIEHAYLYSQRDHQSDQIRAGHTRSGGFLA